MDLREMHRPGMDRDRCLLLTLGRGIEILEVLSTGQPEGMTHAQLIGALRFRRSTLYRYIASLEKLGYVEPGDGNRYCLGARAAVLASATARHRAFRRMAASFVDHASTLVGESVHATMFSEGQSVTVAASPSSSPIAVTFAVGSRKPAYVSASGLLFLAFSSARLVETCLRASAERPPWRDNPQGLIARLDAVRSACLATDESGFWHGTRCIAAPVFDYSDEIVGALSVTLAASASLHSALRTFETPLRRSAQALSVRLGHA